MGDRVSVSFKQGDEESVAFFSHWGGMSFVATAKKYAKDLIKKHEGETSYPLNRLEPRTVMVDFIRHVTKNQEAVQSDLYIGKDGEDGDNSDNGHHIIELPQK